MDPVCYMSFLKFTPSTSDVPQVQLETMVTQFLSRAIGSSGLAEIEIYVTEKARETTYFIIKSVTSGSSYALETLWQNNETAIYLGKGVVIISEIVFYDISLFRENTDVELPGSNSTEKDFLKRLPLAGTDKPNICNDKQLVRTDYLLGCPFVTIEGTELEMSIESNFLVFQNINVSTLSPLEFRRQNNSVMICLSRYLEIYEVLPDLIHTLLTEKAMFRDEITVKNALSLVCVCVSILLLLFTIVLFPLRPELHSLPGYNTLILCIFLLLAQLVYQFGVGQTTLPNWACAMIGMICHLLWLCVMFAMNVCSVDMFLIFRKLKVTKNIHIGIRIIKRLAYIVTLSVFFVIVNVVVSLINSHGDVIGYGGIICYISSKLMQIVTFIIPSVVSIVANITLFIYVVVEINKSSINSAGLQQERNYLAIYARLSTLTGFTWLVGFLLILVQSEVLEYIFVLLNASQGVFIMVAFSLNRKLLDRCCKAHEVTTGSIRVSD